MPQDTSSTSSSEPAVPGVAEVEVITFKGLRERKSAQAVRGHDFRQSGFLAASELRRIRLRHEQFIRSLAARLAMYLRLEVTVQFGKLQIVGYQKFLENLPSPTHITLFRTDPLKGVGLLEIPPRLSLGLVDRLLGGAGQMPQTARDLSEIEIALTDQIANLVLAEWCGQWPEMRDLRPALLGHENNSRFLQTAPAETAMLILVLEAGLGEQKENIQLAFPYATVEPLMRLLTPSLQETEHAPARAPSPRWSPEFDDVKVTASAEWKGLKISAAEIAQLVPGDVLMLTPGCAAQVQLRLSQVPKFLGRPGVCGQKWAIQLTEQIATDVQL
jgi:flagellar motor switch protein FliM